MSATTTFRERLLDLVLRSDTTPTRFFLGIAGAMWSAGLLMPGDTMERPVYRYMADLAPEIVWATAWAAYSYAMFWRVFSDDHRWRVALLINSLGLALWGYTSFSIFATLTYPYPAGTAPDFACLGAALWVFARTHIFPLGGWRGD